MGLPDWLWLASVIAAGALMWASQVSPTQAVSNLSAWAKSLGIKKPPMWLQSPDIDKVARHIAGIALTILGAAGLYLFFGFNRAPRYFQLAVLSVVGFVIIMIAQGLFRSTSQTISQPRPTRMARDRVLALRDAVKRMEKLLLSATWKTDDVRDTIDNFNLVSRDFMFDVEVHTQIGNVYMATIRLISLKEHQENLMPNDDFDFSQIASITRDGLMAVQTILNMTMWAVTEDQPTPP